MLSMITIEFPNSVFLEKCSGDFFEREVKDIIQSKTLEFTKVKNILSGIELWIETTESRLQKIQAAYAALENKLLSLTRNDHDQESKNEPDSARQ